jgi:hypothetical protein
VNSWAFSLPPFAFILQSFVWVCHDLHHRPCENIGKMSPKRKHLIGCSESKFIRAWHTRKQHSNGGQQHGPFQPLRLLCCEIFCIAEKTKRDIQIYKTSIDDFLDVARGSTSPSSMGASNGTCVQVLELSGSSARFILHKPT